MGQANPLGREESECIAEKAGWDKSILAIELQHLVTLDDLDVPITGFEVPEIDLILEKASEKKMHRTRLRSLAAP